MGDKKGLKNAVHEFSDLLILKVIFDNLDEKKRSEFIALLKNEGQEKIDSFLRANIPDLEEKIRKESQKETERMTKE